MNSIRIFSISNFAVAYKKSCGFLQSKLSKQNIAIWMIASAIFTAVVALPQSNPKSLIVTIVVFQAIAGLIWVIRAVFYSVHPPLPVSSLLDAMLKQIKRIKIPSETYDEAELSFNICSGGEHIKMTNFIQISPEISSKALHDEINDIVKSSYKESIFFETNKKMCRYDWVLYLKMDNQDVISYRF